MKIKIFFVLLIVISLVPTGAAFSAEMYGKVFVEDMEVQGTPLTLRGIGSKTYIFIKVFVAGLYVAPDAGARAVSDDIAKRLEVAYLYPVPGRKLAVETRRRIQLNTTAQEFMAIKDRVDVMDRYFVDLKPGDRYALTYIPGVGTLFSLNGNIAGTIPGYDFAKALFSVWIGEKPINPSLKEALLGYEKVTSH